MIRSTLQLTIAASLLAACSNPIARNDASSDNAVLDTTQQPEDAAADATTDHEGAMSDANAVMDARDDERSSPDAEPDVASEPCTRPGALESVPCGNCGWTERHCTAMRVWEYGACTGQGECTPGTTSMIACGMCGARASRCNDRCVYEPSACTDETGDCLPGVLRRTSAGCPAGQTRLLRCSPMCAFTEEVARCQSIVPADVMILLETTGSTQLTYTPRSIGNLVDRLVAPLLSQPDTFIGVSYFGDFPGGPGLPLDRAFQGGVEPTDNGSELSHRLHNRANFGGGDVPEATVEALAVLSGLPIHPTITTPLSCSTGRIAGGCWRPGVHRIVIVVTDSPVHNGPDAATGLDSMPFMPEPVPAPARWSAVQSVLRSGDRTSLIFLQATSTFPDATTTQYDRMLRDLGQPSTDVFGVGTSFDPSVLDAVVDRVRTIRGL